MSLVGDIILELRQRIPDAPGVSNIPFVKSISSTFQPGGQFPPGQTFSVCATSFNQWGETPVTPQFTTTLTLGPSDNTLIVTVASDTSAMLGNNLYVTDAYVAPNVSALFNKIGPLPLVSDDSTYVLGAPPFPGGATRIDTNPPLRNTCFHPDTDGNFIGAYAAFRLLNRAISEMVKIAGGIIDVTGVQSFINQSMYRIDTPNGQGSFYQFVNAWFDGYPMDIVPRSMMYLRNSAAGFSGILSYEQDGPQSVIQVWPQSNRTGGQTFTIGFNFAANNSIEVSDASGFLSIGLAQIENEIVSYSSISKAPFFPSGTFVYTLNGVTRGLGGTTPADHPSSSIVTELNIRLSGYRMPPIYQVGQSAQTLMVPQAWETALVLHMLSQVRSMEQDDAAAKSLQGDFIQVAEKIAKGSRLGKLKPRQIPIWGQNVSDARNVNGIGFGWLIN